MVTGAARTHRTTIIGLDRLDRLDMQPGLSRIMSEIRKRLAYPGWTDGLDIIRCPACMSGIIIGLDRLDPLTVRHPADSAARQRARRDGVRGGGVAAAHRASRPAEWGPAGLFLLF